MSAVLTKLPPAETVRRLEMAKAVIPTIVPETFDMDEWFHAVEGEVLSGVPLEDQLRYDAAGIHLCGTEACFGGHLALRGEFQDLGLGLVVGGHLNVADTTPLPDGRICSQPEQRESSFTVWPDLAWFFGLDEAETDALFNPDSWLHMSDDTNPDDRDQKSPAESLKAIDDYLDELIARYKALAA